MIVTPDNMARKVGSNRHISHVYIYFLYNVNTLYKEQTIHSYYDVLCAIWCKHYRPIRTAEFYIGTYFLSVKLVRLELDV